MRKFRLFIYFSILTQTFVHSGTINFSNFESAAEVQSNNTPLQGGFVAVGTLSREDIGSSELLSESFNQFGESTVFGDATAFNLSGFFSGVAQGDGGAGEFINKKIFLVGGDADTIAESESFFAIDTGYFFGPDNPIFTLTVDLNTGTPIVGSFGGNPTVQGATSAFQMELPSGPVIENQIFEIQENSIENTTVGFIDVTNTNDDFILLEILDEDVTAYKIEGNKLLVNDSAELDYESKNVAKFFVKATNSNNLSSTGIMTVSLTDDRTEDSDKDGLSEAQEEDIYKTSDLNTDSDGDTYDDGLEVLVGTDPASANSYPSLEDALDYETEYVFSPESKANWFFQAEYKKLGEGAAQSGPIVGGEQSSFSTIVDGPTIVEFWWKVSSENGFDYLSVSVNEEIREKISGETDWILQSVKLPEGSNKLTWKYEKDDSISEGLDTGWVDSIEVLPVTGSIGSLSYIIEDLGVNGVKITSCSNEAIGAVEIPELIEGLPVTIIGDKAFEQCVNVKSISIPESVSYIGTEAFAGNSGLDTLFFAGAPPELGENVFEGIAKTATIVPDQGAEGWENSFQNIEVNSPPSISNQSITTDENQAEGEIIGFINAEDRNLDNLVYKIDQIWDLDNDGVAAISLENSKIIINDPDDLDYERVKSIDIKITVKDPWSDSSATLSIILNDDRDEDYDNDGLTEAQEEDIHGTSDLIYDTDGDGYSDGIEIISARDPLDAKNFPNEAPSIENLYLSMSESIAGGTIQGQILVSDPNGDPVSLEIITNHDIDQDGELAFRIEGNAIIVNDNDDLDYEKNPLFKLIIKASDEELSSTGIMTVSLTDDRTEDSDKDGLSEAQEEDIYKTSDLNTDSDGDTYDDGLEVLVGTDPASANSYPSLEDALDYETEYVFSPESKANWFFQAEYKKLGEGAAQSGPIVGGEQSSFSTIVDGPTIVEFWWKVSSENGFDYLSVSVNEEIREKISGETDWILQSVKLPEGSNKLTWKYEKDDSISEGLDTGWVDSIEVLPVTGSIGSLSYIIEDLGVNGVKITSCSNEAIGAVEIPELIEGLPVTIIGDKAFEQCVNVKSISIPESVSYIGTEAFAGNSGLDTLFFAGAPPELGENVFEGIAKTATIVPDQGAEGWENSFQNIEVNFQEIEINQGIVADGYISGATVFIDLNGNGELDKELEPYTLSDDKGNFALTSIKSDAAIIAEGGTDTSTNTFFGGQMKAPNGSTVINPLTTLIETMVSGGLVDTYEEANDELVEVLGLEDVILDDEESINLTNYDPLQKAVDPESTDQDKEIALTVAQAAIQVGSIIVSTVELGGSSQTIVEEISQEILTEEPLAETGTLQERLVETEVIQSLIESSTIEIGIEPTDEIDISELSLGLASTNSEIINSETIDKMAAYQTEYFGNIGVEIDTQAPIIKGDISINRISRSNSYAVNLSRKPISEVVIKVELKGSEILEIQNTILTFDPENWDELQIVSIQTVDGEIVEENIGVNVSFFVDPNLSSTEFINITPKVIDLTVEPKPLNLEISKVGELVQLKWERGKLQKSNDLNPNWEDVRVEEGDNEGVSSPYFYPVDQKNIFFRVSD